MVPKAAASGLSAHVRGTSLLGCGLLCSLPAMTASPAGRHRGTHSPAPSELLTMTAAAGSCCLARGLGQLPGERGCRQAEPNDLIKGSWQRKDRAD